MVAAMPEPGALKERVGALLEEAEGGDARDAFAAASLALVGALTAATGALANSQKEVQRWERKNQRKDLVSSCLDVCVRVNFEYRNKTPPPAFAAVPCPLSHCVLDLFLLAVVEGQTACLFCHGESRLKT